MSEVGNIELVRLLIEANANVNCQDSDGATPLMASIYQNHHEIVKLLLHNGADPYIKSLYGIDAFDQAKNDSDSQMVNILKKYKKEGD